MSLADRSKREVLDAYRLKELQLSVSDLTAQRLRNALLLQVKAWKGVVTTEVDGPLVDFAEAQIQRITSALNDESPAPTDRTEHPTGSAEPQGSVQSFGSSDAPGSTESVRAAPAHGVPA